MSDSSAAIILAAGSSNRMNGIDKLWHPIAGTIILGYTIEVFENSPLIDTIILVVNEARIAEATMLCKRENWQKIAAIIPGGTTRQTSSRLGLDMLARVVPDCRWVMIHDGARPFVTPTLLTAGLQKAQQYQAAIPVVAVKDTIKEVQLERVQSTPERSRLWIAQTPQIFTFPLIHQAHHHFAHKEMTDDAALVELQKQQIVTFPGLYANIKITTQDDLIFAEAFIEKRKCLCLYREEDTTG